MSGGRGHHRGHRRGHGKRRSSRTRRQGEDGKWIVNPRVERFVEPALLLVLREQPGHGYEIAEEVEQLMGGERVDLGNLYRMLRSMEEESLVSSTWSDVGGGKPKRTYELTDEGAELLQGWVSALGGLVDNVEGFVARAEAGSA